MARFYQKLVQLFLFVTFSSPVFCNKVSFLCGFGNAEYQVSGATNCPDAQWAHWEKAKKNRLQSGLACDFWHNYEHDILLAKEQGSNSFRFSIEWSKIEPQEGQFNQDAFDHYHQMIDFMLAHDIVPMITLHHFTDPQWFAQKGGFEKEENIYYFVRFCQKVFEQFGSKVPLWCTINEPTIYVFMGYILGMFPPSKILHISECGAVLLNMLKAHVEVYHALKNMPHGKEAHIGIVHQLLKFHAYHWWNLLDKKFIADFFTPITHTAAFEFLKTGTYYFKIPFKAPIHYHDVRAPKSYDFIGLNYYSRVLVNFFMPTHAPGEIMTDYEYAIYPEGLYKAIVEVAQLNVPIYITENGSCDGKDDRRELFINGYMDYLKRAIAEGYDVRGYYYWTLMDNFEWNEGYQKKFGLYAVDFATQERTLCPGGACLKSHFDELKKS